MYKQIFSLILALSLVASLTACELIPNTTADNKNNNSHGHSNIGDTTTSTPNVNSDPQNNNTDSSTSQIITTEIPTDKTPVISSPSIESPKKPETSHIALSRDSYYQYSNLNKTEKEIYNKIYNGILKTQNIIDLEKYNLNSDEIDSIYAKVLADNPQFFWVSKFCSYSISSQDGEKKITSLNIYYTDGKKTDDINNNKFTLMADRDKISEQISSFNAKTEAFLKTVSPSASELEKERLIHDFVLKNITYDSFSASITPTLSNYPRAWDAYGAMVNGMAVCEGYAKLFQYLCYQVGINVTYVHGTSQGEKHAWNAVKLNGEWYHVDTTWDDGSADEVAIYNWFNLTDSQIETDHTINSNQLFVPKANGNEYSLANTFALTIESLRSAPLNYKKAIDYMVKFGDSRLTVITNGLTIDDSYFNRHLLGRNSTIGKYIKEKRYDLEFAYTYNISNDGEYLYLNKNKKS